MKFRKSTLALVCAATLGALSVSSVAQADVTVYFDTAPPPLRVEAVPAPRAGYVWAPGYWDLEGGHHVWRTGHWERERVGYSWVAPTWVQRDNRWYFEQGRWANRDNDRDGVPNGMDRRPNNPNRN